LNNILHDDKDKGRLIETILDHIKSYLNPERFEKELEIRKEDAKQEESRKKLVYDPYLERLLKRGASPEEVV